MFFVKEAAYTPSIHEMRMEQLFPSSSYKSKNRNKNKNYDFSFFENNEKTEIIKYKVSVLKQSMEIISNFSIRNIDLFQMTPDMANDYYLYKTRKEGKTKGYNFSFYEIDGSINYLRIFSGLFSDNIYIKQKAKSLLIENLGDFISSQIFIDYFSMIFSCLVAAYLFFNLFFNASTFFKYYLNFLF